MARSAAARGLAGRNFKPAGALDDDAGLATNQQAEDDPGYGTNGLAPIQPTGAAPVAPRGPMMGPVPGNDTDFSDDDLMTEEEALTHMAGLLGVDPTDLGVEPKPFDENLAETLDEQWLDRLGQDTLEEIEADLESRRPWENRFRRGLELVGLKDFVWGENTAPFEGASTAVHPMLAEAIVQSQARMMEEVWPAQGPAKTEVMGVEDSNKRDAADRVSDHMNYQLTIEDPTYFMETQKLGLYLPIFGTAYRKAYHDYPTDRNLLRYLQGEELILPYSARDCKSATRKTHRFKILHNDFLRGIKAGAYREVELQEPGVEEPTQAEQETNKVEGKVQSESDDDKTYTFYETDKFLDVPGEEDVDDQGQPTGVALPFTVTLEKETGKVLAIRRCWDESDPLKQMMDRYAEYWYLPGIGVYGFGLIHMIGGLAEAGTDALRALLDSATWANLQGGFKAKDSGAKGGELHMKPGVWQDIDMDSEELGKAFHTPPFKEPSEALFKLLDFLTTQAQRFASTTDMMVGDSQAKGAPVGTTVALIEQGSKVYSGVHKRVHFACGVELQMLFKLNARFIPAEGYPYLVPGDDKTVYQQDYDDQMVSVVPVSDPNIYSQTQRIALAQSEYQLAKDNPANFDLNAILQRMLKAFKDPNPDEVLIDPTKVPLMDPVTENVAMATGRPVKAKDGENHDLHLISHMAFAQHPQFGGLPQAQQLLGPAMMAHVAEHVALKYADTQRKLGANVPPLNLSAQPGQSIAGDENPGQIDQISMAAAQMVGQFMQASGLSTPPANAPDQQQQDDAHKLAISETWLNIANGLAAAAKAGIILPEAMADEQAILSGQPPPPSNGPVPSPGAAPAAPRPGGGALANIRPAGGAPLHEAAPAPLRPIQTKGIVAPQ